MNNVKTLIIPDVHGRTLWKDFIRKYDDVDRIIFLGDYFDSHLPISPMDQLNNFYHICNFKRTSDKEVILLTGNHDLHYWPGIDERYSGYQPQMRASFEFALKENQDILQVAFCDENDYVYSHAGISKTWLSDMDITHNVVENINELFKYKPYLFCLYYHDRSYCGENIHNSPLWIRPNSLYRDRIPNFQIVGHTKQRNINIHKSKRRGFTVVDTWDNPKNKLCLIVDNGELQIATL